MTNTNTRQHETVVEIDAPIDAVWRAITEAEQITRWFAPDAKVEPGASGSIWTSWGPGMEGSHRIEIWEPGRHLQTSFGFAGGAPQLVDYYLEAREGGTVLRLVHSGFGADASFDGEYDATREGWAMMLSILKHGLERHREAAGRHVSVLLPVAVPRAEAWRRLMGPDGLATEGSFQPGASLRLRSPGLHGIVKRHNPEGGLGLMVESLNDSFLYLEVCDHGGVYVMVSWYLFGPPVAQAEEIRRQWASFLHSLFPQSEQKTA